MMPDKTFKFKAEKFVGGKLSKEGLPENLQTYENIDQNLATTASLTDEDIIDSVSKSKEKQNENDEDDQVDDSEPSPTVQQALDTAKVVEKFLLFNEDDSTTSLDMHKILKKYKTHIGIAKHVKQS
ncbi:unnamed protein product [Parnassius apollo]|uniref:(apollo) hypothetical protein n=1 Tax=Parnassius apollo TaxID=110799 RepID=A0A8S3WEG2_PARAO|nr:unnamed protein product [Parnassius apollo]